MLRQGLLNEIALMIKISQERPCKKSQISNNLGKFKRSNSLLLKFRVHCRYGWNKKINLLKVKLLQKDHICLGSRVYNGSFSSTLSYSRQVGLANGNFTKTDLSKLQSLNEDPALLTASILTPAQVFSNHPVLCSLYYTFVNSA